MSLPDLPIGTVTFLFTDIEGWSRSAWSSANAGYDYTEEFAFGLDLILDGIERLKEGA